MKTVVFTTLPLNAIKAGENLQNKIAEFLKENPHIDVVGYGQSTAAVGVGAYQITGTLFYREAIRLVQTWGEANEKEKRMENNFGG